MLVRADFKLKIFLFHSPSLRVIYLWKHQVLQHYLCKVHFITVITGRYFHKELAQCIMCAVMLRRNIYYNL